MTTRRFTVTAVFLALCVLFGMYLTSTSFVGPTRPTESVAAGQWTPSDGFRDGGKCYQNIAFSGPREVPCSSWSPLPPKVRQCTAGIAIAATLGYLFHQPPQQSASYVGGGCVAGLF